MCGIAGIYKTSTHSIDPGTIKKMLSQIQYRGPDESGIYIGQGIGLGNVRLSIIDIQQGQQPMSSSDGNHWIAFNGEIFNFIELREELKSLGYIFRTASDTEVLLILYLHYGKNCLEKLNGQFAFAIWDSLKNELFLARDRLGIRPLYYVKSHRDFAFASEMKCLFESGMVDPQIDPVSVTEAFTFWTIPSPGTLFKDVKELSPGHYMVISEGRMETHAYWDLQFRPQTELVERSIQDAAEEFEELLSDAVRLRLRSDVQVAAYLSGGLDSSATTYYIKQADPGILNTFSIGFDDPEFDETSFQETVSKALDTSHIFITCKKDDIAAHFARVLWHSETPLFRTGAVPMYLLSRLVHDHEIKVVITGEGADEFLGGYNIFKEALIREFWSRQPHSKIRPLLLQKLYPYLSQFKGRSSNMLRFFYGYRLTDVDSPIYSHLVRWNNSSHIREHIHPAIAELSESDPIERVMTMLPPGIESWDILSRAQWLESKLFLSGYLLSSQGDRVAMANSVEGRYPFLDHRVVEFSTGISSNHKMKGLNEKYLLKWLMKDHLPVSVVTRSKQAYRAPVASSLLSNNAPDYFKDLISSAQIKKHGFFKEESVNKLIDKLGSGHTVTENDNMAIAGILSMQILTDQFVYGNNPFQRSELSIKCPVIYDKKLTESQT